MEERILKGSFSFWIGFEQDSNDFRLVFDQFPEDSG